MSTITLAPQKQTPSSAGSLAPRPICRVAVLHSNAALPVAVETLLNNCDWCEAKRVDPSLASSDLVASYFDVALIIDDNAGSSPPRWPAELRTLPQGLIILTDRPEMPQNTPGGNEANSLNTTNRAISTVNLPRDASVDQLRGALTAITQWNPVRASYDKQLAGMKRLHEGLHHHFDAIDRELRLASRMQRDFLPPEVIECGPLRFSSYFRPCTWVSGDIFDIFRLDEHHFGFYLADAVGHGVAAGLLTMYIKHAIKPKRIHGEGYELVRPSQVLQALNDQLAAQGLPDSQFITGWYGLIDMRTLRLDYAVAGHPPPMIVDATGLRCELHGDGSLLGLCPGQTFSDESITLSAGQRLVLYSDGLEATLITDRRPMPEPPNLAPGFEKLLAAPFDVLRKGIVDSLETTPGSITNADDVTLVALDIKEA